MKPKITVLMPVYNGERFLAKAIDSILSQTFKNFELLIINDGSTDESKSIVLSHKDKRIRLVNHRRNVGLVQSLNEGLVIAKGKYIARMDADDIAMPSRLEEQINYLENHDCTVVATKIALFGSTNPSGTPGQGDTATSSKKINQLLPDLNPITHPSVLYITKVIRGFSYKQNPWQLYTEDYDLWLRLATTGYKICKIDKTLLRYRIHPGSASRLTRSPHKAGIAKGYFLLGQIADRRLNKFNLRVATSFIRDLLGMIANP